MTSMIIGAVLAVAVGLYTPADAASDRIYGRVITNEREVVEGYIRWDRSEASWTDFLDGGKEIPLLHQREAESLDPELAERARLERSIEAFGVRITWDTDDGSAPLTSRAGIRFGHIESLEPLDRRSAVIHLRGGGRFRMWASSSDLGVGLRYVVVETRGGEQVELRWRELERIDFMQAPEGTPPPRAARLHGTVRTESGLEFSGDVMWDLDEAVDTDVLNGRADREDHEIPFSQITSIRWESTRSARVTLARGDELVLTGTNDVDRSNRGIEVSDPSFGRVIVPWNEFELVTFHAPGATRADWASFEPTEPIKGTVTALDGRTISGEIRWDNDEETGWEMLDGWVGGIDMNIEFRALRSVHRLDEERVRVLLDDGREFVLEDTQDVSAENRGVFVKPDGRARRLVRWRDFDNVVFAR